MIEICSYLHKGIYPLIEKTHDSICLMGEIRDYKKLFSCETVKETAMRLKVVPDERVMEIFGLNDDPRFYEKGDFTSRKWTQMSFPFQMRATALMAWLSGVRTFSFPASVPGFPSASTSGFHYIALWVRIKQFLDREGTLYLPVTESLKFPLTVSNA